MNSKSGLLVVVFAIGLSCAHVAAQQFDFFWSTQDLNTGALNADSEHSIELGQTDSLYLYVSTHNYVTIGPGAFIDVSTTNSGVIQFLDAESLEFSINVGKIPIGNRWLNNDGSGGSVGHTANSITDDFIDEWHAFSVCCPGIVRNNNGSGPFLDQGYDGGADAFLFGRIDYVAIGPGTVGIELAAGDGTIVSGDMIVDPEVGAATIHVTDDVLLGDVNLDGAVNLGDVPAFVALLQVLEYQAEADVNQDGLLNSLDIPPFVDLIID